MSRGNGKTAKQSGNGGGLGKYITKGQNDADSGSDKGYVDWSQVDASLIAGAVWACVGMGGALLFGSSRDKTSYAVTVFFDGGKNTFYWPCNQTGYQDLVSWLSGMWQDGDAALNMPQGV